MEFEQILNNLKKKIYHPVYFLCGDEPFFIDIISDYIEEKVLSPTEKDFNLTIFYGKDSDINSVIEACRRYPMMAGQQVVIVKEAQSWKNLEPLARYIIKPLHATILVINYKYAKPDGRTETGKTIKDKTVYLETKGLKDYQIPSWIENYIKNEGYSITPQSSQMLADHLGNDLSRIVNELKKLFIVIPPNGKITPDYIERNIGISKEYNAFELTEALGEKNILKANRIVNHFGANPADNPMPPIMGAISGYFIKLLKYHALPDKSYEAACSVFGIGNYPFIVRKYTDAARRYDTKKLFEIMGLLREYDLKSKGLESASGVSQGELLKEMIYQILH
jgi:DNA polymerase III subunit delta